MKTLRWSTLLPGLLVASLAWSPLACGGDDDDASANNGSGGAGTGGSGTNGSGPGANCSGRCATKAAACMLPANLVDPYCQQLCGTSPTEGQLVCIEGKSCQELSSTQNPLSLCPDGGTGGSGTGGSGTGGSGTGGSGTGGSGTGGSGGGGLPDSVTVSGTRNPNDKVTSILSQDQTKLITNLNGGADVTYSVDVDVNIQNAASFEITAPTTSCAGADSVSWTLSGSKASFVFVGEDVLPATDCVDFADDIVQSGLTVRFTDVPVLNSSEKLKTLVIEFRP